ncbi:MAG: 4-alpha-glucanotransferase [Actinomycetota bacterium]|nr:4-alpha-glucanotransferase [Actinomycetota bacterium]
MSLGLGAVEMQGLGLSLFLSELPGAHRMPVADLSLLPGLAAWSAAIGFSSLWLGPLVLMPAGSPVGPYSPESRFIIDPLYLPQLGEERASGATIHERVRAQRSARANAYLRAGAQAIRNHPDFDAEAAERIQGLLLPSQIDLAGEVYLRLVGESGGDRKEVRETVVASQALAHGLIRRANGRLPIGLDIPVGVVPGGVDATALAEWALPGGELGAPPDEFNREGQSWGLVGFDLGALPGERGRFPLTGSIEVFAHVATGFRIDHAIGLQRLCVTTVDTEGPRGTTFVSQPRDDTLASLARLAASHALTLVAEDLGVVPDGLREALGEAGLLLSKVLCFESEPSSGYPAASAVSFGTHDTPTLRQLAGECVGPGDFGDAASRVARHLEGPPELCRLDARFRTLALGLNGTGGARYFAEVLPQALGVLSTSGSRLRLISLRDLLGSCERLNLPGVSQHQRENFFLTLADRPQLESLMGLDQILERC